MRGEVEAFQQDFLYAVCSDISTSVYVFLFDTALAHPIFVVRVLFSEIYNHIPLWFYFLSSCVILYSICLRNPIYQYLCYNLFFTCDVHIVVTTDGRQVNVEIASPFVVPTSMKRRSSKIPRYLSIM